MSLIDWQLKEKISNPKLLNVLDSSPLESLFFASMNHKWSNASADFSVPNQSNPYQFADMFKISQPQFDWITLNERAKTQAWCDLEKIFERKSWHSLKTTKTFSISVPLERVIFQLSAYDAPADILNMFLMQIDDPNRRLVLAKRFPLAGKTVVDTLVELKNREELEQFIDTLSVRDNVRIHGENALKNMVCIKRSHDYLNALTFEFALFFFQKSKWKAETLLTKVRM